MLTSAIRTLVLAAFAGVLFIAAFIYIIAHSGLNKRSCDVGLFMSTCIE
jgi:hypothetical protein